MEARAHAQQQMSTFRPSDITAALYFQAMDAHLTTLFGAQGSQDERFRGSEAWGLGLMQRPCREDCSFRLQLCMPNPRRPPRRPEIPELFWAVFAPRS